MHDRLAAHETLARWFFHYDEGHFDELDALLTDDADFRTSTDSGQHPYEELITGHTIGRDDTFAWQREHRMNSPYPARHYMTNLHVVASRDDEIDLRAYLFATQINETIAVPMASAIIDVTMRRAEDGYLISRMDVVIDASESRVFRDR